MGKSKPKAPKAPEPIDPRKMAAAQTSSNIGTAIANASLGYTDQYTPQGSMTYEQTGTTSWTDPYTRKTYEIPKYASTTALTPEQQAIFDQNQLSQTNLAETAAERSDFLKNYLPNTEALTDEVDNKLFDLGSKRLDPMFERREDAMRTRLANQGITAGSEAWKREMDQFGQGRNDAYTQLALSGRGQALSEINNPINQITALLSGSQIGNPNVQRANAPQMPNTDVAGMMQAQNQGQWNNYNAQMGQYNQQMQNRNSMMGGLFDAGASLGAAAIANPGTFAFMSDRRLKKDVDLIKEGDFNTYEYRYIWEPDTAPKHRGYMAQEVLKVNPEAVLSFDGHLALDYSKLPEVV